MTKIVEKKYRKSYKKILTEQILKPLKLSNTNSIAVEDDYQNIAKPYAKGKEWEEINDFYFPNVIGVGDMISTPQDLNRFIHDLFCYKVIKKETLEKMLPLMEASFGYGIMGIFFYDNKLYMNGGDTYGTHCVMAYDQDKKLSITYTINGEEFLTNSFAIGLLSILYDKDYEYPKFDVHVEQPTYLPSSRDLMRYEGIYSASDFPIKLKVYKEGDHLKAQGTGQSLFILKGVKQHQFVFNQAELEITFEPDKQILILKQSG